LTYEQGQLSFGQLLARYGPNRRPRRHVRRRAPASTFRDLVGHENLLAVYDNLRRTRGHAPGIDGFSYGEFSRAEIADVCRSVSRAILAGTYWPQFTRPVPIPKPNGGVRELRLPTVVDRLVASTVTRYVTELIDPRFSPRSFGFRPKCGVWSLLVELVRPILGDGLVVLAQDDVRQAFDDVPTNLAIECFAEYVNDADLLNLVGVILRGHAGCERTVGIDQGNPLSPLALNVVLDRVVDRPSVADPARTVVLRYADNVVVVARTTAEARQQRRFSAEQLERLLGVSQVESLRSQLQPIVSIQLVVEPSSPPAR
jgi:RNA-directed DNA polymerase